MKRLKQWVYFLLMILVINRLAISPVFAIQYNLIAPSGQLTRGQNVQFTITVDTQNQSVTSTKIGMTYDKSVLEYISTTPGDTFTTVEADNQEVGKLIFTATNASGFSGTGNLAVVTFKLIATAAGKTDLCVLFNPETTPTVAPTTPPNGTTPLPTRLPTSGSIDNTGRGAIAGAVLLILAGAGIAIKKKSHE